MGCLCCRMIKSYITDPSEAADVRKPDSACSSLYQPHHLPRSSPLGDEKQKQGFNNLGYSRSNDSTLKLEVDNNHVNHRLHAAPPTPAKEPSRQGGAAPQHAADGALYIIQPDAVGPRWDTMRDKGPSQVPVYPQMDYENQRSYGERGPGATRDEWGRADDERAAGGERLSADEIDEGVGGTPEYPCDTGDEASVLSVEIHTSTTSLSSADTRDELRPPKTPGAAKTVTKGEEEEEEAAHSITDSMVAEALAAMEAATAGEDSE